MRDTNGIIAMRKIAELIRIENEYWGPRDQGFVPEITDDIVPPFGKPNGQPTERQQISLPTRPLAPIRFAGGRFRFGK